MHAMEDALANGVSIHAPAKGATILAAVALWQQCQFRSTLPRRERRSPVFGTVAAPIVSIHAPAKGATPLARANLKQRGVSIHAPAKGATIQRQ